MLQLGSLTHSSQNESAVFNVQFIGSGRSPEWGVVTPNMGKRHRGASFPEAKLLKTYSAPISLDRCSSRVTGSVPRIKYPFA